MKSSHPYLMRKGDTYYLRVRVPDHLRAKVGLVEVKRSLLVTTARFAKPLAMKYGSRVFEAFAVIDKTNLSKAQVKQLLQDVFSDLASEIDQALVPHEGDDDNELDYQSEMWAEHARKARDQLNTASYGREITRTAQSAVSGKNLNWDALSASTQQDILHGVARAFIEQQKLYEFRRMDRFSDYIPQDGLFGNLATPEVVSQFVTQQDHPLPFQGIFVSPPKPVGPTVAKAVEDYLDTRKAEWTQKTRKQRMVRLGYLVEFMGPGAILSAVTVDHIREFSKQLQKIRKTKTGGIGSFAEKQTDNPAHQISLESANQQFVTIKAFFNWALKEQGLITKSPAENVIIKLPPKSKVVTKPRRPFTAEELAKLFSAPLFTGCAGPKRQFLPGTKVFKNADYWLPILAYYTGARAGELVQLHLNDVQLDGSIPFLNMTTEGSGGDTALRPRSSASS